MTAQTVRIVLWLVAVVCFSLPATAQQASLRGQVTDESGAVIPGATVTLNGPSGLVKTVQAANDGTYAFNALPSGDYTVRASAPQLSMLQPATISLTAAPQTLNLTLSVVAEKQELTVQENGQPVVSTETSANASALTLRGTDLDALSDNPDDLAADLQALAGPAAGPNGGTVFIDGFSGGELPPKNSIREIRINQNPFSPEFDKLGFGRIEIFTKPGTDKFHADLGYNFANDKWNSRNPYAEQKAPFRLNELRETVSGPLGKRASFNLNFIREWVDNGNVVNAVVLDPQTLAVTPFTDTPVSELRRTGVTPRVDYQLSANQYLSVRYAYNRDIVRNAGVGGFDLVSRGYHNDALSQTLQVTETAIIGASVVNEARFQVFHPSVVSQANSPDSAIQVLGAFNGGGNPLGRSTNSQNNYEFQNNTSVLRGSHTIRFGVRLRTTAETDVAPRNFAGTFTFSGGLAPELNSVNQPVLDPSGQPVLINITSIESDRRTLLFEHLSAAQIRELGGGATQFSIGAGNSAVAGNQLDLGAFIGDDWKIRPTLTLSAGLRYETQNNIHDGSGFAPRIGVAWAPGKASGQSRPKSVIRAGFGIFYDRFSLGNILDTYRYNGIAQQQYAVTNPDFYPAIPPLGSLAGPVFSTIAKLSPTLRSPYLMQSAASYERQLPFNTTLALTYANSRGLHMLASRDINAPLPGTFDPDNPSSGLFPLGRKGPVDLMQSSGVYNQNQLILNVNSKVSSKLSLTGSYAYGRAMSNTDGLSTFPANPYSMEGEYGPAAIDMRRRFSLSGTINARWGIRFNPLLTANTGPPFDITAGRDLYGTTLFNARPGIATDPGKPGLVTTPYGLLDPNPSPGDPLLPRNYGRGPGQIMLNMRVSRTFSFGSRDEKAPETVSPSGAPGGNARGGPASPFSLGGASSGGASANRRYSLTVSMQIRNLTNHNNPGPIIGNITAPLFGQANQPAGAGNGIFSESANNRRLELQTRFTF